MTGTQLLVRNSFKDKNGKDITYHSLRFSRVETTPTRENVITKDLTIKIKLDDEQKKNLENHESADIYIEKIECYPTMAKIEFHVVEFEITGYNKKKSNDEDLPF